MNATFSKGQRVHGEYRGQFYKGVITNVTARDTDMVISVKLDSEISVKGEFMPRDKFMTAVSADGDFTASAYAGYMALVSEDVQPTDAPAEVDMGGDFAGFVEAVNAAPAQSETTLAPLIQPANYETKEIDAEDGTRVKATIKFVENGFTVRVMEEGIPVAGMVETFKSLPFAWDRAHRMVSDHVSAVNARHETEIEEEYASEERAERVNRKHDRIAEIRRQLERLDRERDSLAFELSELVGE